MNQLSLNDNISSLKGVGPKRALLYHKLSINTIGDLLSFYPRDYLDFSEPVLISEAILNENNIIKAKVYKKQGEQRLRKGLSLYKVFVLDESGSITITIFNSQYMFNELEIDKEYYFYGKVTGSLLKKEMTSPTFIEADSEHIIRPIYHLTEGLTNKMIQNQVKDALLLWKDSLKDEIPYEIRQQFHLCHLRYAIENIHFPSDKNALKLSQKRLIFEELLVLQLGLILLKNKNRTVTDIIITQTNIDEFYTSLPFELTDGQKNAINDGISDLKRNIPMNRLVQGDVGSGKTMVAAALCYLCFKNEIQSAIMAPTQILADQHYDTLSKLLTPLGVNVCLLTGSLTQKQKNELINQIQNGDYSVVIGTHALIQESVQFKKLGLVVTDEQHRFGVAQRALLSAKGDNPHLLVMSATPIPRTLALIIYGDLDVSVIKELPKGRQPIDTFSISSKKRERALNFIKENIDKGRQAYIVCPLIEESENDLISTTEYIEKLKDTCLKGYKIGSLNGKLKPKEKDELMTAFKENRINILVSTTVVEVGVDVPNATIMMIENAERFGLSQLHQLRGRVGRGEYKSYCILVSDNLGEDNIKRLKVMKSTSDGFTIASEDLKLRGPGDFFGHKQHGLPELKIANLLEDMEVLKETQTVAREILEKDTFLSTEENKGLKELIDKLFNQNEQNVLN